MNFGAQKFIFTSISVHFPFVLRSFATRFCMGHRSFFNRFCLPLTSFAIRLPITLPRPQGRLRIKKTSPHQVAGVGFFIICQSGRVGACGGTAFSLQPSAGRCASPQTPQLHMCYYADVRCICPSFRLGNFCKSNRHVGNDGERMATACLPE